MAKEAAHLRHRGRTGTEESPPRFRPIRTGIIILAVIGGFLIGVLVFTIAPKVVSNWREAKHLKRAGEHLKQGDFTGANEAARQAIEIDHDSLPAYRILAEATEKQNRPETLRWRAEIARLRPHDIDSQLNLASAALRFGQLDAARKALEAVPTQDRESAAYNVVAGWLSRAQGDEVSLERHFAAALEKEPKNETYQYNLAVVRIKSSDSQKKIEARETLEQLSKDAPFRAGSLRALLNDAIQRSDPEAADRFAQELQMSQQVIFSDYLLCLEFYKKLDPKKFSALLEKVKPIAARESEDLASLLAWLNSNGMAAEVLRWTDKLPTEKTIHPLPSVEVAEALSSQRNWSRLRKWTKNESWADFEYLRLAYQAYAARRSHQTGADSEFALLWREAERAATENPEREIRLARLASKWDLPSEAEQLWLRVAHNPLTRREALDALFAIYRANNDLPNLYLTSMRLHEASPNEPLLAAEYARLSLVLQRDTSEGRRVAKEAFDQAPEEPLCAIVQALSLDSVGRSNEGIEILKKIPPEKMHEPHNASYAAVLLLDNNEPDPAREFIDAANAGPVFVEEKRFMEDALQKSQSSTISAPPPPESNPGSTATPGPRDLSPR